MHPTSLYLWPWWWLWRWKWWKLLQYDFFFLTFFNCFIKNWFKQMAGSRLLGCTTIKSWPLFCKDFFVWKGENCGSTLIEFFQVVFAAKCLCAWLLYEFARFSDSLLPNPYSFISSWCYRFLISVWPKGNSFTLKSQLPTACYCFLFKCVCLFHTYFLIEESYSQ